MRDWMFFGVKNSFSDRNGQSHSFLGGKNELASRWRADLRGKMRNIRLQTYRRSDFYPSTYFRIVVDDAELSNGDDAAFPRSLQHDLDVGVRGGAGEHGHLALSQPEQLNPRQRHEVFIVLDVEMNGRRVFDAAFVVRSAVEGADVSAGVAVLQVSDGQLGDVLGLIFAASSTSLLAMHQRDSENK